MQEEDGITRIGDLHPADFKKIGSLALIELTAILDNYSLPLNKRKTPKMRPKGMHGYIYCCLFSVEMLLCSETGVFGVSIDQMLTHDLRRRPHYKGNVPLFLEEVNKLIQ